MWSFPVLTTRVYMSARRSSSRITRQQGNTIEIRSNLKLPVMRIEPHDYGAFAEFCRKVDQAEAKEIVVTRSSRI